MDMSLPRELYSLPQLGAKPSISGLGGARPTQFEVDFDREYGVIWGMFNPKGTPCFSLGLLNDIRAHDEQLELNKGRVLYEGEVHEARYYVAGSKVKGVFNLGGDLGLGLRLEVFALEAEEFRPLDARERLAFLHGLAVGDAHVHDRSRERGAHDLDAARRDDDLRGQPTLAARGEAAQRLGRDRGRLELRRRDPDRFVARGGQCGDE